MSVRGGTLTASGLKKTYDRFVVLGGVDLALAPSTKLGIVGPNGIGKSTLLRLLAGRDRPDAGTVRADPPDLSVGYLSQELDAGEGETVSSYLSRRTGVARAEAEVDALAEQLGADPGLTERYTSALERFVALGGGDLESRARATLTELGLDREVLDRPVAELSPGQAARVQLAAILLSRYDVLLLDEPTNNLDFDGLERLEAFCASHAGALGVVSHDRAFLDRVCNAILEITEPDRTAELYRGSWSDYVEVRAERRHQAYDAHEKFLGERDRLRSGMQRQREWAAKGLKALKKKRTSMSALEYGAKVSSTEKQASKIRSMERRLQRLERDKVEKPWEPWNLQLQIAPARRSGQVVARLTDAVVVRGSFTLGPMDLEIGWAERVAILGPNGAGKSTLLGAILGRLPLESGERYLGPGVVVGEIDQARAEFDGAEALLDRFVGATHLPTDEARTLLAKFGLGPAHVMRSCDTLSPGERTRAGLAVFQASGVNCLVLDEPSNHLDLEAIEQLEAALEDFRGTLLLVTHDRYMLDAVDITSTIRLG